MNDTELQEREAAAQNAAQLAHDLPPGSRRWGLFSYDDGPPAAGGGVGCFLWFESEPELFRVIETHIVFLSPGPSGSDVEAVLSYVHSALDRLRGGQIDRKTARLEINTALKQFSQISWWGLTADLYSDTSSFPRQVRRWFRENRGNTAGLDQPITTAERTAFLESLEEYGL